MDAIAATMNIKLAILSVILCLAAVCQSVHVAPNGRELVFSIGTNSVTTDRRKALGRINQINLEINGLKEQLAFAQKVMHENPPRIIMLEHEKATQGLHLEIMRVMGVTNLPNAPVVQPPSPPGVTPLPGPAPLPVNASVLNGFPPSHSPEFISGVKTAR